MTKANPSPPCGSHMALFATPWPDSAGLRADSIDTAAALIVIEVLLDALAHLPDGQAMLADARRRRTGLRTDQEMAVTPLDAAAVALALALIEAAADLDEDSAIAA